MNPANSTYFSSDLWQAVLEKFAAATQLTVQVFDAEERAVLGPFHPTPLFNFLGETDYNPGIFAKCARQCLEQTKDRPAVIVSQVSGLTVIGTSLDLQDKIVGALVGGYVLLDFSRPSEIEQLAMKAGVRFERLWQVAREQRPVPQRQLIRYGELLQVLGDALLRENLRVRQSQQNAEDLEGIVGERTASLRKLSLSILRTQDDERRRIARELHDSVGQYLAYAKMTVETSMKSGLPEKQVKILAQATEALDKCVSETRTISHLLHPPLLEEVGFASAAEWYVKGFSQRSGILANLRIPRKLKRMPSAFEITLFRVLQESLTNVYRHAQSQSVDIGIEAKAGEIALEVRDYGQGMPPESLERFRHNGGGAGVGLSSMRERIAELGGRFDIESGKNGTTIRVTIPVTPASPPL
ncbi:MAG TPA: ATP-binding protein [Terriglobia bacterium]|nr:ATP-binding protein [Terriglobia bacterium]